MVNDTIHVGQRLPVVPVISVDRNRWRAKCPELPEQWSCWLTHRASADLVPDASLLAWVLAVDPKNQTLEVSDSNFGFLPISDRMRPRYVMSLKRVADVLQEGSSGVSDAEYFSEVKGMFSRCVRRDQWDWYAVHLALGEPPPSFSKKLAAILAEVSAALRSGRENDPNMGLELLRREGLSEILLRAAQRIVASAPRIPNTCLVMKPDRLLLQSEERAAPRTVLSQYSKGKLDSASAVHADLLDVLAAHLGNHGYTIEANQFIDAFTRLKSGPAIFEAKSLTDDNEVAQVRYGLSQLYEYRFRHGLKDASLWLLLSRKPKEAWLVEYLEQDRGIGVIWVENGQLSGPSVETLIESGSDALRRSRGSNE